MPPPIEFILPNEFSALATSARAPTSGRLGIKLSLVFSCSSINLLIFVLIADVGLSKRDAYKLTTFFIKHGQSLFNDYSYDISDKELFSVDFADNLNRYTEETKGKPFNTLKKIDTNLDGEEVFY